MLRTKVHPQKLVKSRKRFLQYFLSAHKKTFTFLRHFDIVDVNVIGISLSSLCGHYFISEMGANESETSTKGINGDIKCRRHN